MEPNASLLGSSLYGDDTPKTNGVWRGFSEFAEMFSLLSGLLAERSRVRDDSLFAWVHLADTASVGRCIMYTSFVVWVASSFNLRSAASWPRTMHFQTEPLGNFSKMSY